MKKILKKTIVAILLTLAAFTAFACSSTSTSDPNVSTSESTQSTTQTEITQAKEAYSELCFASLYCEDATSAIYSAWRYSIYTAENDKTAMYSSGSRDEWDEFLLNRFYYSTEKMNNMNRLRQAIENFTASSDGAVWAIALCNPSYSVAIAKEYNKLSGVLTFAKEGLNNASSIIKELSNENKQSTHKDELADLYVAINNLYELAENPSGSYNTYGTNISNLKTDINNKIERLKLYLS